MPASELIAVEELLAPVSDERPCGESLKYQPLWDEIVSARRGRTDAVSEGADLEPEWRKVQSLACEALATRTKDLQIAGWLTEALIHTDGYAGFRDGLRVLRGLVESYWEGLFPEQDESDPEVRAAPLHWLADGQAGARLPGLLREVPITVRDEIGEAFSVASKPSTQGKPQRAGEDSDDYAERVRTAEGRAESYRALVAATPDGFYIRLRDEIAECFEEVRAAERAIDEKLGVEHSPSWSAVRQALEDCQDAVTQICRQRGLLEDPSGEPGSEESLDDPAGANGRMSTGPVKGRSEAIARLREVADFFKKSEPHSPVSLLIERAVRWANSPFETVLAELIQDDNTLSRIRDTLGLQSHSNGSSEG